MKRTPLQRKASSAGKSTGRAPLLRAPPADPPPREREQLRRSLDFRVGNYVEFLDWHNRREVGRIVDASDPSLLVCENEAGAQYKLGKRVPYRTLPASANLFTKPRKRRQ